MTRTILAITLAIAGVASAAHATDYRIKIDGYCDRLNLHVIGRAQAHVWGASVGFSHGVACDNSALTGTAAIAQLPVQPAGPILTAAGDLGQSPGQFVYYINLINHTYVLYGTVDGVTTGTVAGTWSDASANDKLEAMAALPPLSQRFVHRAAARPSRGGG